MLRVRTVWTGPGGAPLVSTLFFNGTTEPIAGYAVAAVAELFNNCAARISTAYSWSTESDVMSMDEDTGAIVDVFSVTPEDGGGTDSTDLLPFTTQGLIRFSTPTFYGGRRVKGRLFMPGATETQNTAGRPSPGYLFDLSAAAATYAAHGDAEPVVWSRANGHVAPISGTSVWTEWAELRSRRD
jgi:hypothetical protein